MLHVPSVEKNKRVFRFLKTSKDRFIAFSECNRFENTSKFNQDASGFAPSVSEVLTI